MRGAGRCPGCGTASAREHERVVTCPKDVRGSSGRVRLCWVKRRWKCQAEGCRRKTFTESVPQVPPQCRVTGRLRDQAGTEVAVRGITLAEAARHGRRWPIRCWSGRTGWWLTWGSMSTAGAGVGVPLTR